MTAVPGPLSQGRVCGVSWRGGDGARHYCGLPEGHTGRCECVVCRVLRGVSR